MVPSASSLLGALRGALAAMGDERDAADVAGLSGLAFRLQVDEVVSPASVAAFPWAAELPAALSRLGYAAELVYADDEDPRFDAQVERAIAAARRAFAAGRPALLWGVHLPEFGLAHGDDAAAGALLVSGVLDGRGGAARLPYRQLGRGDVPVLWVAAFGERQDVPAADAARAALLHALRLGRGLTARYGDVASGLAAWAAWRAALEDGRLDPAGHAYVAHAAAEWRAAAPVFVERAAAWIGGAAAGELFAAARALSRVADALATLAGDWPWPLPDGAALVTTARRRHAALLDEAAAAEAEALAALERALEADRRARASAGVRLVAAAPADAGRLFACTRDLPLGGLDAEAGELRGRLGPRLGAGDGLRARLALAPDGEVVGHVYYADLDHAGEAVDTVPGRFLYVYCMWVARERRGAGLGARLVEALRAEAARDGYDGIFVEATAQEIFLHHGGYEALGFEEVHRLEDDARLLCLPLTAAARARAPARLRPAELMVDPGERRLPVVVAHGRPCPLLLRATRHVAAAARACAAVGAPLVLEERSQPPHGIAVGGRRLPLGYLPREAAQAALVEAADAWYRSPPA